MLNKEKITVGWKEWCTLPELSIPMIKAKIDTGAKTSSLHTIHQEIVRRDQKQFVKFIVDPIKNLPHIQRECLAEIRDIRHVKNSGGSIQERIVIATMIQFGETPAFPIEITLTNRKAMQFKMLIGRQALSTALVEPTKTYLTGTHSRKSILCYYSQPL
jgi:ribosomal protein S6--L-glutamate ligase